MNANKLTEELLTELVTLIEAANLCCPEQVCDFVLEAARNGGRDAAIAELERAKANDAESSRSLGIEEYRGSQG